MRRPCRYAVRPRTPFLPVERRCSAGLEEGFCLLDLLVRECCQRRHWEGTRCLTAALRARGCVWNAHGARGHVSEGQSTRAIHSTCICDACKAALFKMSSRHSERWRAALRAARFCTHIRGGLPGTRSVCRSPPHRARVWRARRDASLLHCERGFSGLHTAQPGWRGRTLCAACESDLRPWPPRGPGCGHRLALCGAHCPWPCRSLRPPAPATLAVSASTALAQARGSMRADEGVWGDVRSTSPLYRLLHDELLSPHACVWHLLLRLSSSPHGSLLH